MLEFQGNVPYLIISIGSIADEFPGVGYLGGNVQKVQGRITGGGDIPIELSGKSFSNQVDSGGCIFLN